MIPLSNRPHFTRAVQLARAGSISVHQLSAAVEKLALEDGDSGVGSFVVHYHQQDNQVAVILGARWDDGYGVVLMHPPSSTASAPFMVVDSVVGLVVAESCSWDDLSLQYPHGKLSKSQQEQIIERASKFVTDLEGLCNRCCTDGFPESSIRWPIDK